MSKISLQAGNNHEVSKIVFSILSVSVLLPTSLAFAADGNEFLPALAESPDEGSGDYNPPIGPCEGVSIEDAVGEYLYRSQKHDGQRFNLSAAGLAYDDQRELWYDDQGGSTWACQQNSNAEAAADGSMNLVYSFRYNRSNAGSGSRNMWQRLDWADTRLDQLAEGTAKNSCFTCGLIRHKKGCFPPGVKVTLGDGKSQKVVEDIAAGDELWNPVLKRAVKVENVVEGSEENPLIEIAAGELKLKVSDGHPIYTKDGLKQAKELSLGDTVFDAAGKEHRVESLTALSVKTGQTVINFSLEDSGEENARLILADGLVVGDIVEQQMLAKGK